MGISVTLLRTMRDKYNCEAWYSKVVGKLKCAIKKKSFIKIVIIELIDRYKITKEYKLFNSLYKLYVFYLFKKCMNLNIIIFIILIYFKFLSIFK